MENERRFALAQIDRKLQMPLSPEMWPEPHCLVSADGIIMAANAEADRILRPFSKGSVVGSPVSLYLNADCPDRFWLSPPGSFSGLSDGFTHWYPESGDAESSGAYTASGMRVSTGDGAFCFLIRRQRRSSDHEDMSRLDRENRLLRQALDTSDDFIFMKDVEGRFIFANRRTAEIMGAENEGALIGRTDVEFYPPDLARRYRQDELEFFRAGKTVRLEQNVWHGGNRRGVMISTKTPLRDENGVLTGYIGTGRDITEQEKAKHALRQSKRELNDAQVLGHMGSWSYRQGSGEIRLSAGFRQLLELSDDCKTLRIPDLLQSISGPSRFRVLRQAISALNSGQSAATLVDLCRSGDTSGSRIFRSKVSRTDTFDEERTLIGVVQDVTLQVTQQRQLHRQATTDTVTGALNRDGLFAEAEKLARRKQACSLLLIDLDGFKDVNDTFGHGAGDETLAEIAQRLRICAGSAGYVARLGGDEFAVLIPGAKGGRRAAFSIAQHMLTEARREVAVTGGTVLIGASIGIAHSDDPLEPLQAKMERADTALYQVKRGGRNGIRTVEANGRPRSSYVPGTEDLVDALVEGDVKLRYTPVYSLSDGHLSALDCETVWIAPDGTEAASEHLTALAESAAVTPAYISYILHTVFSDLLYWSTRAHPDVPVRIPLTARQFRRAGVRDRIIQILDVCDFSPRRFSLNLALDGVKRDRIGPLLEDVNILASRGIDVLIADFDTGSRALSDFPSFPFSGIRISGHLNPVHMANPVKRALLKSVSEYCRTLGVTTAIGEIGSEGEIPGLRAMGMSEGSGPCFGTRLDARAVADHLRHPATGRPAKRTGTTDAA